MTKIFTVPFAENGDKISPPDAVQPDGSVSYNLGYGFDYQRDTSLDSGGAPVDPLAKVFPREQHNGILNDITTAVGEIQANGLPIWQSDGGPYPVNALVRYSGSNWKSTSANNATVPGAPGASWVDAAFQPSATETISGIARIATQDVVSVGSDDSTIVSPKKLAVALRAKVSGTNLTNAGFTSDGIPFFRTTDIAEITALAKLLSPIFLGVPQSPTAAAGTFSKQIANLEFVGEAIRLLFPKRGFAGNDFIRIPDQAGGLIIQWGRVAYTDISVSLSIPITLSTPFPTVNLGVIGNVESSAQNAYCTTTSRNLSSAVLNLTESSTAIASGTVFWIAIGN